MSSTYFFYSLGGNRSAPVGGGGEDRGREPGRTGGGRGTGDGRKKGGKQDLYDGGKPERNSKRQAFVICYCLHPDKETKPTTFLDFHLTFSQNFIRQKRQKTKICTRDKKNPFRVAYIIGHEWVGMTHVHVCRLCQSRHCLVCLASCRNSP